MERFSHVCGVDVGGTFTDFVLIDLDRNVVLTEKLLTTIDDPAEGILAGLAKLQERLASRSPLRLVHATTLITNALIERKGAKVGLLATEGFRDVLDMRRENRFDIFDLKICFPEPIVPGELRWEVSERMAPGSEEVRPLDREALRSIAAEMRASGVESVAITFLHAYEDATHERQAADALREFGEFEYISLSGEVAPLIREYERTSTVAVNAYTMPLVDRYLKSLQQDLVRLSPGLSLSLMVSNGGVCSPQTARRFPVRLLESGPVAGALVAGYFGKLAGASDLLAFDMGGTTAKLCVVRDGVPNMVAQFEADRTSRFQSGSGIPILAPSVDLVEIGAGGGSIASVDRFGLLQVGPRSTGARPGPACYGNGGREPTVTDADLLLGYINPAYFLGGRLPLDAEAARQAVQGNVAETLNVQTLQAAWGIHDVVDENMARAAWLHMAEKGLDPRRFTLVATGGAGPVHACHLAAKLGITHVICPPAAGVASAIGLVVAPPRVDVARSFLKPLERVDFAELNAVLSALEQQTTATLFEAGLDRSELQHMRMAEMLYAGQTHHIEVTLPQGELGSAHRDLIAEAFAGEYRQVFGSNLVDNAVEIVALRVAAWATASALPRDLFAEGHAIEAEAASRDVYFAATGRTRSVAVWRRGGLRVGRIYAAPAIVEAPESSVVIEPGWNFVLDAFGILHLRRE